MPAPINEDRILDAALEIWREEGLRDATTRKVAERAGIGEVTIFRRFGDKSALFTAALAKEADLFAGDGIDYTGDLTRDLKAIIDAYSRLLDRNISLLADFMLSVQRDAVLDEARHIPAAAMARVGQVIAQHQAAGHLRNGPPMELVLSLLSPILLRRLIGRVQPGLAPKLDIETHLAGFLQGWATPVMGQCPDPQSVPSDRS
ncbi:TetR/AcrR family transcriptional regulator [Pseudaestuariivita rosea]|uniref:TetR/AcrR family transcriptional regulator n=1 Tax=Pseudaestuariivita rosea TaxID=2763263 RepID=UPI001ABB8AE6|nr:TetR/AcrR family transcriptional regulator [Pseudaestuariivita rosea]